MEDFPKEKYSVEKYHSLFDRYSKSPYFFSEEVVAMRDYLREKYKNASRYAFFHILGGSSINSNIVPIEHEDFPGEDSVELFLEDLLKKSE